MTSTELIKEFYNFWESKNIDKLREVYHSDLVFNDPLFSNLNLEQTLKMWGTLFNRNKDPKLNLSYKIIKSTKNKVISEMVIKYNFGKKQRPVTNKITRTFTIKDSLIIDHLDEFDFILWVNQVLGLKREKSKVFYKFICKIMIRKANKDLK